MRLTLFALCAGLCLAVPAGSFAAQAKPAAAAKKYTEPQLKDLEAKLAKSPNNAKLKTEAAEANYQVGYAMMMDPALRPMVKYPGALKKFNRALQLNPKHAKAAADKKQIEDIYRQMGRPIPQ
jgi:hypothetical protein